MKKAVLLLCIILVGVSGTFGQSGWLDGSFGNSGIAVTPTGGTNSVGEKVAIQSDGKIVVARADNMGSNDQITLIRYLTDGSLDMTFGTAGVVQTTIPAWNYSIDLKIQTDGKILVLTYLNLLRFNSDGSLDVTFNGNGWVSMPSNYYGFTLGLQSNGRIAVGASYAYNDCCGGTSYLNAAIMIYNTDGSPYSSTLSPSLYNAYQNIDRAFIIVQNDDKVVVCGRGDFAGGYTFRVNSDGTPDLTYGSNGNGFMYFVNDPIDAADMQSDGKIVVLPWNSGTIKRITTGGALESVGGTFAANNLKVVANDKILLLSGWNEYQLTRLNNDATADVTFSSDGIVTIDLMPTGGETAKSIAVQADGKYVITGDADNNIGTIRIDQCTPQTAIDSIHVCDVPDYTWIDGVTYTSSNYTATYTLNEGASNGCDSIITLNLTIANSNAGTDTQTACDSYTWIDGNTYTSSNNSATWILTNAGGCDSTVTLDLTINASPGASATDNGDGSLSATGSGTYQWIDCANNTAISGATDVNYAPTVNGDYAVIVDNGNCADTSACVTINYLGVGELSSSTMNVYPNPTSGDVTIDFEGSSAEIALMDATGKQLRTQTISSGEQCALADLAAGIYFVSVTTDGKTTIVRIYKQ